MDGCRVDESHMTGESEEVLKSPEGSTLMLSGSKVLEGYGRMLVVAVGPNSQQGRLSALVAGQEVANGAPTAKLPTAPEAGGEEGGCCGIGVVGPLFTSSVSSLVSLCCQLWVLSTDNVVGSNPGVR